MRRFVIRRNIDRYRQQLRSELNDERRRMLRALLAEEESKLAAMDEPDGDDVDTSADKPPDKPPDSENRREHRKPD